MNKDKYDDFEKYFEKYVNNDNFEKKSNNDYYEKYYNGYYEKCVKMNEIDVKEIICKGNLKK
jgi:hypothetical protein